jgi:D-amino-acid dehydrogenase
MTPDLTPFIGRISELEQHRNIWINSGHGTLGWTMLRGSGSILVDLIAGQPHAINAIDFVINRTKLR